MMEEQIDKGAKVEDIAEETSHKANADGITGFMYGAAVAILSQCWEYGEELKKWHNEKYGHKGEGVINPAIFTIYKK